MRTEFEDQTYDRCLHELLYIERLTGLVMLATIYDVILIYFAHLRLWKAKLKVKKNMWVYVCEATVCSICY